MAASPEWMYYLRVPLALIFVVGLIFLFAAVARKAGLDKRFGNHKGRASQLEVVETLYLDPKRRLVTVRSGDKEHLLLLGVAGDLLIESRARESSHG